MSDPCSLLVSAPAGPHDHEEQVFVGYSLWAGGVPKESGRMWAHVGACGRMWAHVGAWFSMGQHGPARSYADGHRRWWPSQVSQLSLRGETGCECVSSQIDNGLWFFSITAWNMFPESLALASSTYCNNRNVRGANFALWGGAPPPRSGVRTGTKARGVVRGPCCVCVRLCVCVCSCVCVCI